MGDMINIVPIIHFAEISLFLYRKERAVSNMIFITLESAFTGGKANIFHYPLSAANTCRA